MRSIGRILEELPIFILEHAFTMVLGLHGCGIGEISLFWTRNGDGLRNIF